MQSRAGERQGRMPRRDRGLHPLSACDSRYEPKVNPQHATAYIDPPEMAFRYCISLDEPLAWRQRQPTFLMS